MADTLADQFGNPDDPVTDDELAAIRRTIAQGSMVPPWVRDEIDIQVRDLSDRRIVGVRERETNASTIYVWQKKDA